MFRKGFTLIELIVVIAIIAILAAIVAPNAFRAVEKAKISGAVEDFRSIKTGAMAYYADVGTWPANCSGASACQTGFVVEPSNTTGWDGPYVEKWPAAGKWGGVVNYTNTSGSQIFNSTSSAGERYATISNVPWQAAANIDKAVDGTKNTTSGGLQYTNGSTVNDLNYLISRDGAID